MNTYCDHVSCSVSTKSEVENYPKYHAGRWNILYDDDWLAYLN